MTLGPVAQRVSEALAGRARLRVRLPELWSLFDDADPGSRGSGSRRARLADCLDELAGAGLVRLPAPASWERDGVPPLPAFVTLVVAREPAAERPHVVWHPELAWAATSAWSPAQRSRLEQVNRWLFRSPPDVAEVPMRERSLEVFGHEKVLDGLEAGALFAPGRLSRGLLRYRRVEPAFAVDVVGDGDVLLVAENSDTYDSLRRVLAPLGGHRVSHVAWGAGAAFKASVLSVRRLVPHVAEVAYFGDLDEEGLASPLYAAALAAREGLPPLRPAEGLYELLLRHARPQDARRLHDARAAELTAWLPPGQRGRAAAHLTAATRLAQETVGHTLLRTTDTWLADLAAHG